MNFISILFLFSISQFLCDETSTSSIIESKIIAFEDFLDKNNVDRSKLRIEQFGDDNIGVIAKSTIERNGQILKIPVKKIGREKNEERMRIREREDR